MLISLSSPIASTTDKANRLDRPVDTGATKRYTQLAVGITGERNDLKKEESCDYSRGTQH
jgi:hypothetical protein